jgi:HD-like signal output (HDOD) protein
MEHKLITVIKNSELLPKIAHSFGKILKIPIDSYNYDMDACAIKLSKYPQLEAALIRILNVISKLNRNIITI